MVTIRPFDEADRAALRTLGSPVVGGWHGRFPSLHLVAASPSGEVVGHLQAVDRGERAGGFCETILRFRADGDALLERALAFARERGAKGLQAAYLEEPLARFLLANGFVPFERYLNSRLDLRAFEPSRFADALRRPESQGVHLVTYAQAGDAPANRRALYELEVAARTVQPFREAGAYTPPEYEAWEPELEAADPNRLFLARAEGRFVGIVTGFSWAFTGVHPDWQGSGIATALKVWALTEAKAAGVEAVETENHEDNAAMLAVNRKLGYTLVSVETNCRLRIVTEASPSPEGEGRVGVVSSAEDWPD